MKPNQQSRSRRPAIIAHRGASHIAPENTLGAFRLAWDEEADGIEGDFYVTQDGEIVCMHDPRTGRTADQNLELASSRLDELRQLDVGLWKGAAWRGERIPTLREVLALLPESKSLFLEVKCGPEILSPLKTLLAETQTPVRQVQLISFDESVVAAAKREFPEMKAYWLTDLKNYTEASSVSQGLPEILAVLNRTGADGVDLGAHADRVDAGFVQTLRDTGREVHIWGVNTPELAVYFQSLGVDSLTTDYPALIRNALDQATK